MLDTPRPKATHVLSQLASLEQKLKAPDDGSARARDHDMAKEGGDGGGLPSVKTPKPARASRVPALKLDSLRTPHPPSNLPTGSSRRKKGRGLFRNYEYTSAPGALEQDEPKPEPTYTLPFLDSSRTGGSLPSAVCTALDRDTLQRIGIPDAILNRASKLLSAYVLGFNGLVRDLVSEQPEGEQPALVAVMWQSFLGVVEDNFKVQYSSNLGSIAQMWLEQHSSLNQELSGVSQNLDNVHSQNVVLQEAIIQTQQALEQEKGAKQYALRLREHADMNAAKTQREMAEQKEELEQLKLVTQDLMSLPGKYSALKREAFVLKQNYSKLENVAALLDTEKDSTKHLRRELDDLKMQAQAATQAKEMSEKYSKRVDEQMDEVQAQLRSYHETIKSKEKQIQGVEGILHSTQQLLKAAEKDAKEAKARCEQETKLQREASMESKKANDALDRTTRLLEKLRNEHAALQEQKAQQAQDMQKQMDEDRDKAARHLEALKNRLNVAMGDKSTVVLKMQSELQDMQKWKEQQRAQKEAAHKQIEQMNADFANERVRFEEKMCEMRKDFETEKHKYAAEQMAEVDRLQKEMQNVVEQHTQEMTKLQEARKKESGAAAFQLNSMKRELATAVSERQKMAAKLETVQEALKHSIDELNSNKEFIAAQLAEFKAEISQAKTHEAEAKSALEVAKLDIEKLQEEIHKRSENIVSLQEMVESGQNEILDLKKLLKKTDRQLAESKKQLAASLEQKALVSERVTVLVAEKNAVEKNLGASQRQAAGLQQEVDKLQDQVGRMKENGEAKIQELRETLEVAQRMNKLKAAASMAGATKEINEAKSKLETELALMTEQMESYRDQLDEALEREADLRAELAEQEDTIDTLHTKLLDAQIESTTLKGDLEDLETQRNEDLEAQRKELEAAQQMVLSMAANSNDRAEREASYESTKELGGVASQPTGQQGANGGQSIPGASQEPLAEIAKKSLSAKISGTPPSEPASLLALSSNNEPLPAAGPVAGPSAEDSLPSSKQQQGSVEHSYEDMPPQTVRDESIDKKNLYKQRAAYYWAESEKEAEQVRDSGTVQMRRKASARPPKKSPRVPEAKQSPGDDGHINEAAAAVQELRI